MSDEKIYVDAIRKPRRHGSGFDGHVILTSMRLPAGDAYRKFEIADRISSSMITRNVGRAALKAWHKEKEDIAGPLEAYVVKAGDYRIGQVLDAIPSGAIPAHQWKWKG